MVSAGGLQEKLPPGFHQAKGVEVVGLGGFVRKMGDEGKHHLLEPQRKKRDGSQDPNL